MTALLEGALVGCAVTKLLKAITDEATTVAQFTPLLESIKKKIHILEPSVRRIEELSMTRDHGNENRKFAELLEKGTELVIKCSKVEFWNLYSIHTCSNSLSKLDKSISTYLKVTLPLLTATTALGIQNVTTHLSQRFDEYITSGRFDVHDNGLELAVSQGQHKPPTQTFGLEIPLAELKMNLLVDEVKVLVLCGQGGCGKTTLAKKLCEESQIKGIYGENIYFLTVSKVPNQLALNQLKAICNANDPMPKLVILDDVWLASEQVIEDYLNSISNLKLLVTSRCALPTVRHRYQLKLLDGEDANKLFSHAVYFGNDPGDMPDKKLTNKIVKICSRLPLALTVVGKSLKGQHWTVWETRVAEMVEGQIFVDSEEAVLNCLRTCVDDLDFNLKELFLDLGAFPEDMHIPAAVLVDISVERYKKDKHDLYALKDLFQLHMRQLISIFITSEDPSKGNGFCNEHFVTQHDLLRQLSIFETSKAPIVDRTRLFIDITGNSVPLDFQTLKNNLSSARLVSITTDETFTSKWIDMKMPKAEVLILNLTSKLYGLPHFMSRMNNLKVLVITNGGLIPTELINLKILGDFSNLKRVRFERISFSSLGRTGMRFQNLTKMSFVMCKLQQAINKCTVKLTEMLPALEEIDINCCDDLSVLPPGLCDLPFLTRLSLTNCPKLSSLPKEISNLSKLETLRLHACTKLSELPNSMTHLQKLWLLDISDCYNLDHIPENLGRLQSLKTLLMNECPGIRILPSSVQSLMKLSTVYCDEHMALLWKEAAEHGLKKLDVRIPKKEHNLNWIHIS